MAATQNGDARRRNTRQARNARPPEQVAGRARGQVAASRAIEKNTIRLTVPGAGVLTLPSHLHLAWYAGLATVAALGIIEWPVAAVLAAGHLLAADHHHRLLHDFGEALGEA